MKGNKIDMADKIRILFTGDSITDTSRTELVEGMTKMMAAMGERPGMPGVANPRTDRILGAGYVAVAASILTCEEPGKYEILNRGIAGNRIVDLDARIKNDCINLKPDVLSILVGINGVAHDAVLQNGVDAEKFERVYDSWLTEIKKALPDIKIIMMTPYLLRGPVSEQHWDYFVPQTALRCEVILRLAEKHGATVIDTQKIFTDAYEQTGNVFDWTQDGVHPSPAGHMLMARKWIETFKTL